MTTKTPTPGSADGVPPSGFPDVETLARLANEFFAALPAVPHVPAHPEAAASASTSPPPRAGGLPHGTPMPEARPAPSGFSSAAPDDFIGERPAYRAPARFEVPRGDATPPTYGLPAAGELRAAVERSFAPAESMATPTAQPSRFYFLEHVRPLPADRPVGSTGPHPPFDVSAVRRDFPILAERINGRPLVWLDNAATTQKPRPVIDRLVHFYEHENSNIHRAAHELAARATDAYEAARGKVARFLGAGATEEILFVRGATEGINLIAKSWGPANVGEGDEIVVTWLEHHANIVPWQQLAAAVGAKLRVAPVDDDGQVRLDEYAKLLNPRTRLVAFTHVSNALGTITPAREMVELAHRAGAVVLVDGAQAVSHMRVNVQALDADFYAFSGHKVFAPTGIGAVFAKRAVQESMPPWQGGGNMIADVTFERTSYREPPQRFEAGTGNIADAVGLGAALDYLERLGMENVSRYEQRLLEYGTQALRSVPGLRLVGTARDKASVMSFVLDGYAPEEIGTALNQEGIAVRAGHHCAQPILRRFGLEATVRPSLALYNTCEEIDLMVAALHRLAHRAARSR